MIKKIVISTIFALIISACTSKSDKNDQALEPSPQKPANEVTKGCTKDAKICPDGRAVVRNPEKNCEFDDCITTPKKKEPLMCTADVKQCADGSYVGRDPYNNCKFRECPPENNGRDLK